MIVSLHFVLIFTITLFSLLSCEKNGVTLSPKVSRFIASEHLQKIEGKENLALGVKEFLSEEQALNTEEKIATKINKEYLPENHPKFPLPYFLVPDEDAQHFFADSIDPRVADQLTMKISGKKHYKFFIHPELEVQYDFLRASFNFVGPDQTEFFASPTSNDKSLLVWNKNNKDRRPFIAKVGSFEIERSLASQKCLERTGDKKLSGINLKFFPETAGLKINKSRPGSLEKLGGQIIREIPDAIFNHEKKWLSLATLISSSVKTKPMIMDIIKKSGLTSYDFFNTYMIDGYLKMFEELSFRQGINFEPSAQSLFLETTTDLLPTGIWVLSDLGSFTPDVMSMAKNAGPVDVFMESANASKFKLKAARSNYISSYVLFYKQQVFDKLLDQVAKYDSNLTSTEILRLKDTVNLKYTNLINSYLGLNLKAVPDMSNYKMIEEMVLAQTIFENKNDKKEIRESENLKTFIENKKAILEWVELAPKNGVSEYYLTDHALYEISGSKKVIAFALFNNDQLTDYKANNKMLPNLIWDLKSGSEKSGCFGLVASFFKENAR